MDLLGALRSAGSASALVESVDPERITEAVGSELPAELTGNTLGEEGIDSYLASRTGRGGASPPAGESSSAGIGPADRFAGLCACLAARFRRAFGDAWMPVVPLHPAAIADPELALRHAASIHADAPALVVRVPFSPHRPAFLDTVQRLTAAGIPVAVSALASVRQASFVVHAAAPAWVCFDPVQLNHALGSDLLGERTTRSAQRWIARLRGEHRFATRLMATGIDAWQLLLRMAGCDALSMREGVLADFLRLENLSPMEIRNRLALTETGTDLNSALLRSSGRSRVASLFTPADGAAMEPGTTGAEATGGLFQALSDEPGAPELADFEEERLPDLDARFGRRIDLDTLYSLRECARIERVQERIDARLRRL